METEQPDKPRKVMCNRMIKEAGLNLCNYVIMTVSVTSCCGCNWGACSGTLCVAILTTES